MILDRLTTKEIKWILTKLLQKVEIDEAAVELNLRYREVFKSNNVYYINYDNGFEQKTCSISSKDANISSESMETNGELTKYYKKLLTEVFTEKKLAEIEEINAHKL